MQNTQAGRRYWAIVIKRTTLGLAFVFSLGLAWDWYFFEPDQRSGMWAGVAAIAIYLAASLALGLLNLVSGAAYLWLFGGKDLEDSVLTDLRNANLPAPTRHQSKRFDYLVELVDDEGEAMPARLKAAGLYAAYQVAIQRSGMFGGLALAKALDDATLRYADEAPATRRPPEPDDDD